MRPEILDEDVQLFQDLIREKSGMDLQGNRLDSLRAGIYSRMESIGLANPSQYYSFLRFDPAGQEELEEFLSYMTINETYFFRNTAHFAALRNHVLAKNIKENKDGILKIWSAGCSTGEEPYSIAMTILDLTQNRKDLKIEILGTDVDKEALAKAEQGIYRKRALRVTKKKYKDAYFIKNNGSFEIDGSLRDIARFEYFNLMETSYPKPSQGNWDIIFCRNVIIYFNKESVRHVVNSFHRVLADSGHLFMGHSETLDRVSREFSPIEVNGAFIYVKTPYRDTIAASKTAVSEPPPPAKPWEEMRELIIPQNSSESSEPGIPKQNDVSQKIDPTEQEQDAESIYMEASRLLAQERFDEALDKAETYMELKPDDARGHLLAGTIYGGRGLYERSVNEFERSIELEPLLTEAHYLLGVMYQRADQATEAINEFKKAIYIDANCVLPYFGLACLCHSNGMKGDAAREYNNAIKILEKMEDDEILRFSGGLTVKILMQICRSKIEELSNS